MTRNEILRRLESVVEESQVAILATTDSKGKPCMRWMTLAMINGRPASLFAVTSPRFRKIKHIESSPDAEWMIQTRDLNTVVNVKGTIAIVDNPSLKSEVLESIGKRLEMFWRVNRQTEFVVLETTINKVTHFTPLERKKEVVSLAAGTGEHT